MNIYHIREKEPPKTEPFLALTNRRFEIMEWKERIIDGENKGWFGFYCPCACCNGHCTDSFDYWMPLPLAGMTVEDKENSYYVEFGCSFPIAFNTSEGIKVMHPGKRYDNNLNEIIS